ncbi:chromosome segregation protein SMC [Trueperella bialowiezensis]|uniref:Chromosome partition protein Smc n=1 Tax=Trueperella bialowiezensis TaxID=312285 RepID=A0A448PCQ5_9ACTO|nr:chromosome segregation protein SMC [Trueperella bialowiezensis]VEI12702.1 Chromosome partition protein Smc [Trueperella bialowiezensis]
MHLKTLTLRGFKSFATATTLHFEPGINCVVGPNGSGKSNVVDALAWVMGEQGAKNLRGGAMADVIFAGTAKRPALGRAEVTLTIDNSDGALPIDYSEVTISRTLFRTGGSEYAINGTACRLLDIQELLSDSGMGKEMHVIIGQGKLDEVLTATPEDRRGFIEEAAGVLKHRRRKEKALRKLESMQGNLTRIEDLAAELRRQLGPLARQAATARRAQVIQAEVFDARARILADDVAQAQARLQAQAVDEEKFAAQREQLAHKLAEARAEVARLQAEADAASPHIAALTEDWQRLSSLVERFRSLGQLAMERQRSLTQAAPNTHRGESPESIRQRAQQARLEEEALAKEVRDAEDALHAVIAQRERAEAREAELTEQLAGINRTLADRRETAARLSGKIATATSRIEALTAERERVLAAVAGAEERAAQAETQVIELEQQAVAHADGDDSLSISHEEAARSQQEARDAVEHARQALVEAQAAVVEWRTKADTLELSLEPQDATAWLVGEHRAGVQGLVRDAVKISAGWEAAAEAALAGVAEGAIVKDVGAAVDALRAARQVGAGHLELLVADAHTASDPATSREAKASEALNVCGLAADQARLATDVITGESTTADALRALVAGTVLCIDLAAAQQLLDAGAPAVATMAGDVLTPSHAWGGEVQAAAILSRQAAYDDARTQQEKAQQQVEEYEIDLDNARARAEVAEQEFNSLAAELSARDSQLAAVTAQLGVLRQSVAAAHQEVERNSQRADHIDADLTARSTELDTLREQQDQLDAEPEDLAARASQLATEQTSAHKATVAARSDETEARLKLRTREERLRASSGKSDALENQAKAVEARIAQEERQAARRADAAQIADRVAADAHAALAATQELLAAVTSERHEAEAQRSTRETELSAARRYFERLQAEDRELGDVAHRQELALAEQRLKYDQLAERAISDLGMSAEVLVAEFGPHLPIKQPVEEGKEPKPDIPFVRAEQEKRLAKAERDLSRLGKINPLALEEHAALEERQRYLTEQLEDLRRSRADLLGIVKEIDERVEEVMTSALADVAREFESTFARLFPGGKGKLTLTDPDDVLTTGVDIEARPPGKRVKRLSLLSGGERSLTAIAFLVAIFKARPSPFYVMDEVEAALDDTNLSRLLGLFEELQDNSQLLIITHQKRTMEIADALYGVAMREDGVTTVISQRVKDLAT